VNIGGSGHTINGAILTDIYNTKASVGISVGSGNGHNLNNIVYLQTVPANNNDHPVTPIVMQASTSGVLNNVRMTNNNLITPLQFQITQTTYNAWTIGGDVSAVWNGQLAWTPTQNGIGGTGLAMSGTYTKKGSMVYGEANLTWTSGNLTTSASPLSSYLSNMPIAPAGSGVLATITGSNGINYGNCIWAGGVLNLPPSLSVAWVSGLSLNIQMTYRCAP